ncbi:outer dynein arm-docking complex subunit 3 [Prorops nasuta]|uniref:outer dynein arm-docking complex subunit 3 n=1 Tax=Prorops nasuta TaxID=863751 RepID=UPI0034CD6327
MSYKLVPLVMDSKLTVLNKKIIEIKKKIQLSEGQRKANFEENDAKKHENLETIINLKKEVKNLYAKYAMAKNNDEAAERAATISQKYAIYVKKCGLEEAIFKLSEDNIRLRKKNDLIKYRKNKHREKLCLLLREFEELMSGKLEKLAKKRLENSLRKKIISLEVQLEKLRMMQIKADIVRRKYKSVYSGLKEKSVSYSFSLKELENSIKEQENEIKRLQGVKEEAIMLRDATQETLTKEEIELAASSAQRDQMNQDYRRRVNERKQELERLERLIFLSRPRDSNLERRDKICTADLEKDGSEDEVKRLEDAFSKLRCATGVTRSEDVLNRFLGQRATKESLQNMRAITEKEKMLLEKTRQELNAAIESLKFSETKNIDQDTEEVERFGKQITEQLLRKETADLNKQRVENLLNDIIRSLWQLIDKIPETVISGTILEDSNETKDSLKITQVLNEKLESVINLSSNSDQFLDTFEEISADKIETVSIGSASFIRFEGKALFPRFPTSQALAIPFSEDEEEVPTRNILKRQAQLLVDTKSRRKGFHFKR